MEHQGDLRVLVNAWRKKVLCDAGDPRHTDIRLAMLVGGGSNRGVYAGGCVAELEDRGFLSSFDALYGVSTGGAMLRYFMAGTLVQNLDIYWKECSSPEFISPRRVFRGPIVDTDVPYRVFRGEGLRPAPNEEAIREARPDFYVTGTCAKTGKLVLLDVKRTTPNSAEAIRATIAIPGLSRGSVHVDGHELYDGAGANPFPITEAVRRSSPTDLLIFANCPRKRSLTGRFVEMLVFRLLLSRHPRAVRRAFTSMGKRARMEIANAFSHECRVCIIWTDDIIQPLERNSSKLKAAAERSRAYFSKLFEEARLLAA